jgi:hypothetical protein
VRDETAAPGHAFPGALALPEKYAAAIRLDGRSKIYVAAVPLSGMPARAKPNLEGAFLTLRCAQKHEGVRGIRKDALATLFLAAR